MLMKADPFWYTVGPTVWVGGRSAVAMLGHDVASKQDVLLELSEQLEMPDAMPASDMTWDDLVVRLSELDWPAVETVDTVALVHLALPDMSDDVLAVYLDALRRALDGRGDEAPRLVVAFPQSAQPRVATLSRPG